MKHIRYQTKSGIAILILSFIALFNPAFCLSNASSTLTDKIYIHPHQIQVSNDAILIYLPNGEAVFTDAIKLDEQGLYIDALLNHRGPCGIHTTWCRTCGGCGVLLCPMNCTCFD